MINFESEKYHQSLESLAKTADEYTSKEVERRVKVIFSNASFQKSLPQKKELVEENLREIYQKHPKSTNRIKKIITNPHETDSSPKKKRSLYEISNSLFTKMATLLLDNPYMLPGIFGPSPKKA